MVRVKARKHKMVQVATKCSDDENVLEKNETQTSTVVHHLTDNDIKEFISNFKTLPHSEDKLELLLQMFETATNLNKKQLAIQISELISSKITKHNAVTILKNVSKSSGQSIVPSAPPMAENTDETWISQLTNNLKEDCIIEIEKNANFTLEKDEFLDLTSTDIERILTSDTLEVTSEMVVYRVIMKWAKLECKRRGKDIESVNMKLILKNLAHAPRYGLMSEKEFLVRNVDEFKGPDRSGILDENYNEIILNFINNKKSKNKSDLPFKWGIARKVGSERVKNGGKDGKVDKMFINFLTCWTAVFD